MRKTISFSVPGNPKALKRHRTVRAGKFNREYDPSIDDKADFLAIAMQHKPIVPLDRPLFVKFEFYFKRPNAHYGTGSKANILKPNAPTWHTSTPDADNLIKFVCDALNTIFWKDDRCICAMSVKKTYSLIPRIDIKIVYNE